MVSERFAKPSPPLKPGHVGSSPTPSAKKPLRRIVIMSEEQVAKIVRQRKTPLNGG